MSSIVDGIIQSESGFQDGRSDAHSAKGSDKRPPSSSARPRGPPSISTARPDSEAGLYPDDEIVGARDSRRQVVGSSVPRVVDQTGEALEVRFEQFLEEFTEDPASGVPMSSAMITDRYYVAQINGLRQFNLSTLYVDFTHLMTWGEGVLAEAIQNDFYRYHPYLIRALHKLIAKHEPRYFKDHRQPGSSIGRGDTSLASNSISEDADIPMGLKNAHQQTDRLFSLAFYNLPLVSRVRQLRTEQIGKLVSMSGTVTRSSEIRPELHLATFICEACNSVIPDVEQIFKYSEPTQCPNLTCGNRNGWRLDVRQSTFIDWQKVRIQENSSEIPTGSMPRTMDVILRGEMVDRAKAGEKCIFTGTLIVVPDVSQFRVPGSRVQAYRDTQATRNNGDAGGSGVGGLKALGVRDLTYRMAFLANMVTPDTTTQGHASSQQLKGQANNIMVSLNQMIDSENTGDQAQQDYLDTLTPAEIEDLRNMVQMPNIFMRLVDSLAPMVYGHTVVKKGLLLQLLGGVSKVTPEGMALRGDINICVVGDPSTSKSQFLKYVCSFLPRAVYTSGKASSAAGLTAAVVKDEETGEFTIEAGALMLADNGICCIDEFDKMDIADQVAIHEAMEQQTISIAKAGIQATLNARTSILAAANPVGGRYNRKTTLRANINMSAPIMSRFDLFFVVLDECNEQVDEHLAKHIVGLHQLKDEAVQPEFSTEQLQRYIRFAQLFQPVFTDEAKTRLVELYKELRADDAQGGIGRNSYRITVRQLESLIRLSEAIAKATCVEQVTPHFVEEAYKLLKQSIISVEKDDVEFEDDDDEAVAGALADADDAAMVDEFHNNDRAPATPQPASRQRTQITYDDYIKIHNLLLRRVATDQAAAEDGVGEDELLIWYLEQIEADLHTQDDLERASSLARKVLKRMLKDNVLLQIRGEGLTDADDATQHDNVMYVVHPNCAVDEI